MYPALKTMLAAFAIVQDRRWFAQTHFAMCRLGADTKYLGVQAELDLMRPFIGNPDPDKKTLKRWAGADYEGDNAPPRVRSPFANRDGETMGSNIDVPPYTRTGLDCLCLCGREYRQHKPIDFGEYLFLYPLCDGRWVKL